MPSHWSVVLRALDRGASLPSPRSCHAMARSWLDDPPERQPQGVAAVAPSPPRAPRTGYSVGRPFRHRGLAVVPISLADDDLEETLMARVAPGPLTYTRVGGEVRDPGWAVEDLTNRGRADWQSLFDQPVVSGWRMRHVTAATRQLQHTRYTPELDAGALMRRPFAAVQGAVGGVLHADAVVSEMLTTDLRLESRVFHPVIGKDERRLTVSGCQGWRQWRVLDAEAARIVSVAMRLAEFTAVGSLVTYGFGQVEVEPV